MLELLILAAAAAQENPPLIIRERPQGAMPGENRTLSQPHPNATDRMFPDLAINGLRLEGDTLYVLVANQGRGRARGPIRVTARAESDRHRSEAAPARTSALKSGESRWVPLRQFAVKSASAARTAGVFALEDANIVSATVSLAPPISAAVDRTGQACLPSRGCVDELNEANNSVRAAVEAIPRGRP